MPKGSHLPKRQQKELADPSWHKLGQDLCRLLKRHGPMDTKQLVRVAKSKLDWSKNKTRNVLAAAEYELIEHREKKWHLITEKEDGVPTALAEH